MASTAAVPPDRLAARRLRTAKLRATALLCVAAAVYVVCRLVPGGSAGGLGYVQAGADAGLVGGLADWFAVTALFRHPLGLRIPHTALIPRQKVELAAKLAEFVRTHFLSADQVAAQIRSRQVAATAGRWLATPVHADRLARELAGLAALALGALDEANLVDYVLELVRRDASRRSYAPLAGRLLRRALAGQAQRPLVDVVVSRAHAYLAENRDQARAALGNYVDRQRWYVRMVAFERTLDRLVDSAIETLAEVEADPGHPLRVQLDGLLTSYADALEHDSRLEGRLHAAALGLLADTTTQALISELVGDLVASVRVSLGEADGDLTLRIAALLRDLGSRLGGDRELADRLEAAVVRLGSTAVSRYGTELDQLIAVQAGRWSGIEISERIELAVGTDLQFIRINGTAVGALAGIAIHAVAAALP